MILLNLDSTLRIIKCELTAEEYEVEKLRWEFLRVLKIPGQFLVREFLFPEHGLYIKNPVCSNCTAEINSLGYAKYIATYTFTTFKQLSIEKIKLKIDI